MEFILILAIGTAMKEGITSQAVLFPNEVACEIAREKAEKAFSVPPKGPYWLRQTETTAKGVCVPRQAPGLPK